MIIFSPLRSVDSIWSDIPEKGSPIKASIYLVFMGLLLGMLVGAVISVFRIGTTCAYERALAWTGHNATIVVIFLWIILALCAGLLTGCLIRNKAIRFGGERWINTVLADGQSNVWGKILLPKFLGSWLVMAFGISVGREGPCIQMGAATALGLENLVPASASKRRFFILGGCAAGLAAAFSAPFAGICYVYEVMKQKMSGLLFVFMLSGGFGVYLVCTRIFGLGVMMPMEGAVMPDRLWLLLPLAVLAAAVGIAYNYLLRISRALYSSQTIVPALLLPIIAFAGAALLVLIFPAITGEGLSIFSGMDAGHPSFLYLLFFLVSKLAFTAFCYGTGIPAGMMVPVLCLGGVLGGMYGDALLALGLSGPDCSATWMVLGMCGAFAAAERAPVTAMVLVAQMTGAFSVSPGMLLVAAVATFLARVAKVRAI